MLEHCTVHSTATGTIQYGTAALTVCSRHYSTLHSTATSPHGFVKFIKFEHTALLLYSMYCSRNKQLCFYSTVYSHDNSALLLHLLYMYSINSSVAISLYICTTIGSLQFYCIKTYRQHKIAATLYSYFFHSFTALLLHHGEIMTGGGTVHIYLYQLLLTHGAMVAPPFFKSQRRVGKRGRL
jgi:hypothetical protein